MQSYEVFAPFYDAVQGDRAEHAAYLRGLTGKHHPEARRVLELACGTGSVLKQLQDDYQVTGVDRSEEMLAIAALKVPQARLLVGDMTEVRLDETFDVVLCVYDSINHLLKFEQWESVFDRAHEHLGERGIFIIDINTERRLAWLAEQPPVTSWFDDGNLLLLDVRDERARDGVIWDIKIFESVGGDCYRVHAEEIREVSFPVEQIRASLRDRFRRVRVYVQQRARPSVRSGRVHFVCTK
jgi:SAM-dependent methyltransferase